MSNAMKWSDAGGDRRRAGRRLRRRSASRPTAQTCTPSTNVEAIIDDSGSMLDTDANELRRGGLELFVALSANRARTLGAVEFGSLADTVFAPAPIATSRAAWSSRCARGSGRTAPSARRHPGSTTGSARTTTTRSRAASADNPNATARIFLTDGGHNENEYANLHRGGPRTFVVGHEIGAAEPANPNATRLQQIADETGGRYFPNVEAVTLQSVFNDITQALSCAAPPKTIAMPTSSPRPPSGSRARSSPR